MSEAQLSLLSRLIRADREYRSARERGQLVTSDDRGVEVGYINGVSRNTARALCNAGLAEMVELRRGQTYIFLGSYAPFDEPT